MTPADLDELERLARAATPGPWVSDGCDIKSPNEALWIYDEGGHSEEDARYIAAANPETTLALIARVRELEKLLTWTNEELGCPGQEPVDEFEFGHYCASCDSSIDRNMALRKAIRAALTPKGSEE